MWVDGVFMGQIFMARCRKTIGDSALAFNEVTKQMKMENCSGNVTWILLISNVKNNKLIIPYI